MAKNTKTVEETKVEETVVAGEQEAKVEETVVAGEQEAKVEKKATPKVDIIRGRMPAPVVLAIKSEPAEATDGALAAKYRTTNGKISDIRKDRNFAYITAETFAADQGDCDKTVEWAEKHGDKGMADWAKSLKPATAEARAKYDEARAASRPGRKKKVEASPEGGEEKKIEATIEEAPAPDVDADLAELSA